MKNLIDFFVNYKHWFVFALLEVISLVMLFSYNGYQKSVYFTTANGIVGNAYSAISSVSSYLDLKDVNSKLEIENEELRKQLIGMEQKLAEMGVDSLQIKDLSAQYNMVNALVVSNSIHRSTNLITINKGEADGIRPEMGVVCSSGVVGIVYMTSAHYSIVIPLISIHSHISCRVKGSEYFGTLTWKRGSSVIAYASGFPLHAKFKKGEFIETNGYSDIFPPGIPIGKIMQIMHSEDGMSFMFKVQLCASFSNLRTVSVITNYIAPERKILEQTADSLNIDNSFNPKKEETPKKSEDLKKEQGKEEASTKKDNAPATDKAETPKAEEQKVEETKSEEAK